MNKLVTSFTLLIFILLAFLALSWMTTAYEPSPDRAGQDQTIVISQSHLSTGSQSGLVVVFGYRDDHSLLAHASVVGSDLTWMENQI